jgi:hypothetical protein
MWPWTPSDKKAVTPDTLPAPPAVASASTITTSATAIMPAISAAVSPTVIPDSREADIQKLVSTILAAYYKLKKTTESRDILMLRDKLKSALALCSPSPSSAATSEDAAKAPPPPVLPVPPDVKSFVFGDRVRALWQSNSAPYFSATVLRKNKDDSYDLMYDDRASIGRNVHSSSIRSLTPQPGENEVSYKIGKAKYDSNDATIAAATVALNEIELKELQPLIQPLLLFWALQRVEGQAAYLGTKLDNELIHYERVGVHNADHHGNGSLTFKSPSLMTTGWHNIGPGYIFVLPAMCSFLSHSTPTPEVIQKDEDLIRAICLINDYPGTLIF